LLKGEEHILNLSKNTPGDKIILDKSDNNCGKSDNYNIKFAGIWIKATKATRVTNPSSPLKSAKQMFLSRINRSRGKINVRKPKRKLMEW
jgi:hypothetical protein